MIDLQEYLDAGFSEPQARLLISRDMRYSQSIESLRADMQRGFADLTATMLAGFNQILEHVDRRFARVDERLDGVDRRLGTIEESLRHISPN